MIDTCSAIIGTYGRSGAQHLFSYDSGFLGAGAVSGICLRFGAQIVVLFEFSDQEVFQDRDQLAESRGPLSKVSRFSGLLSVISVTSSAEDLWISPRVDDSDFTSAF